MHRKVHEAHLEVRRVDVQDTYGAGHKRLDGRVEDDRQALELVELPIRRIRP